MNRSKCTGALLAIVLVVWTPACGFAGQSDVAVHDFTSEIAVARNALDAFEESADVPGFAVAIAIGDTVVLAEGRGLADLDARVPVTLRTRFRLGSVSKLLTAATLARLVDAGEIDWTTPIERDVPGFPNGDVITPIQLAGHLGGIRNYETKDFENGRNIDQHNFATATDALGIFRDDALVSTPGTEYHYTTLGYTLLMAVIEAATGETFLEAVDEHVLSPLRMSGTIPDRRDARVDEVATFYNRTESGFEVAASFDPSYKWGGGGMLSSVLDLVAFGQAHVTSGFLEAATLERVLSSQITSEGVETGVGVGWRLARDPWGRRVAHHAGSIDGGRAVLVVYPDEGVVVALLANVALHPLAAEATAQMLADPFLYRTSNRRSANWLVSEATYALDLPDTEFDGWLEVRRRSDGSVGAMSTLPVFRLRGERFGLSMREEVPIVSIRVDETEGFLVLATELGLVGVRTVFGEDDFEGEVVALNAHALEARFHAYRVDGSVTP